MYFCIHVLEVEEDTRAGRIESRQWVNPIKHSITNLKPGKWGVELGRSQYPLLETNIISYLIICCYISTYYHASNDGYNVVRYAKQDSSKEESKREWKMQHLSKHHSLRLSVCVPTPPKLDKKFCIIGLAMMGPLILKTCHKDGLLPSKQAWICVRSSGMCWQNVKHSFPWLSLVG